MLLAHLVDQLAPSFKVSVQKNLQTAVGVLARALKCADPQHCTPEHYQQPLPTLYRLVETYLRAQGKSSHTIRNTKNNLSRLFRLAEQQHLFALAPVSLTARYDSRHKPRRPGKFHGDYYEYHLKYPQWPTEVQQAFGAFETWATKAFIVGREAQHRKRASTLGLYRQNFEAYFGYLQHIAQIVPTFEHLFDLSCVSAYVQWHINECHKRPTVTIRTFLSCLIAMTVQYRPMSELRAQLQRLNKTIPTPPRVFNKEDAWLSLATLEAVAKALWPQRPPAVMSKKRTDKRIKRPGIHVAGRHAAVHAGMALMLRLWTYIPYRQRNMREMELEKHLHKNAEDHWRITFRDEELKIGVKHGRANVFDLPFPDTLVPLLEEYLTLWRPMLLSLAPHPHNLVFLTQYGTPYTVATLRYTAQGLVYRYTGKHWHPHIVRTVWATEWIRKSRGDFYTAAIMLNDKLETVISTYAHLLEENVAEKVYKLLEERNSQGK